MNKTTIPSYFHRKPLYAGILGSLITIAPAAVLTVEISSNPCAAKRPLQIAAACNPCNPCAVKNACSPCNPRNPCAAKNACNPCNPCAAKNACSPCNPCNPCGGTKVSPCAVKRPAGTALMISKDPAVIAEGKRLWNDNSLSTNGLSCQTCHANYATLNKSFAQAYPHKVAMVYQQAGFNKIDVDEMVQFCMIVPMQAKPFPWNSRELEALSSYTVALQGGFNPCAAKNPCNPCKPCAAKNPCNPCAAKNPCNPCNPCAAKNPCQAS